MDDSISNSGPWGQGEAYEPYVGRWSRLIADAFLKWLSVPALADWLDVGCGTGALSQTILDSSNPKHIKAIDRSEAYLEFARRRLQDARVDLEVDDAQKLPVRSDAFDAAVSGLVLNFVQAPAMMVAEMKRAVRPGGVVALYVWDYAGKMQLMRHFWNAVVALDPSARELDEGRHFPICNPDKLRALFADVDLVAVDVIPIDIETYFTDFDD